MVMGERSIYRQKLHKRCDRDAKQASKPVQKHPYDVAMEVRSLQSLQSFVAYLHSYTGSQLAANVAYDTFWVPRLQARRPTR